MAKAIAFFICVLTLVPGAFAQRSLKVVGEVILEDPDTRNIAILVKQDSSVMAAYETNEQGRFGFKLDYDTLYSVEFSHKGYMSKSLIVDTRIPREDDTNFNQLVSMKLELLENRTGVDVTPRSLGKIFYSRITGEFTYQTRYRGNVMTDFQVSGTDINYASLLPGNEIEEEEEEPPPDSTRQMMAYTETPEDYDEVAARDEDLPHDSTGNIELDQAPPSPSAKQNPLGFDTTISRYSSHGMDVTEVVLSKGSIRRVYHRVQHDWGGLFYFKHYRCISKVQFYLETRLDRKEGPKTYFTGKSSTTL